METMKTKIKVISLILATAALSPVAISLSSCAPQTSNNFKYIDYSMIEDASGDVTWKELKTPSISLDNLLFGTNKFNEGNYVVMFSTTCYLTSSGGSYVNDLIFNSASSNYDIDDLAVDKNSSLAEIYRESLSNDKDVKWGTEASGLAFVSVNDVAATADAVCSPFAKWVEEDKNIKDKDGKSLITKNQVGKYIRNDAAAKNFRAVINKIKVLFSNADNVYTIPTQTDSDSWFNRCRDAAPYFVCWKKGKPVGFVTASNSDTDKDSLISKFKDIYKDKDSSSD